MCAPGHDDTAPLPGESASSLDKVQNAWAAAICRVSLGHGSLNAGPVSTASRTVPRGRGRGRGQVSCSSSYPPAFGAELVVTVFLLAET